MCVYCLTRPEEGIRLPRMGMQIVVNHHVMLGIEYGSWEEQVVLVASEPSLQPLVEII